MAAKVATVAAVLLLSAAMGCFPRQTARPGDRLDAAVRAVPCAEGSPTVQVLVRRTNDLLRAAPEDGRLVQAIAVAEHAVTVADGYRTRWRAARACSYVAQWHSDPDVRRAAAERGYGHAQAARDRFPERVGGHFFLAVNLGLRARQEPDAALRFLEEVVKHAEKARELDDSFQQGGPLRTLGGAYLYAPPWPTSIGDVEEAEDLFAELVERFPDYPLNHYFYGETLMKLADYDRAAQAFRRVLKAAPRGVWRLEGGHFRQVCRQRLSDIRRIRRLRGGH